MEKDYKDEFETCKIQLEKTEKENYNLYGKIGKHKDKIREVEKRRRSGLEGFIGYAITDILEKQIAIEKILGEVERICQRSEANFTDDAKKEKKVLLESTERYFAIVKGLLEYRKEEIKENKYALAMFL